MIVDLEEKEESGTFELRGGGKVHLRLLSSQDVKEIEKACSTSVVEYPLLGEGNEARYRRFESVKFDTDLADEMKWDRVITGWEDLFDVNEIAIPVTKENKVRLMKMVPMFIEAVNEGLKALKAAEGERAEQARKNSSNG